MSHQAGLIASRVLGAPLKLDIIRAGAATVEGVRQSLVELGCDEAELEQVLDYMSSRGSPASLRGLRKLWFEFALI